MDHFLDYPDHVHQQLVNLEEKNFWFLHRNQIILYALNLFFPGSGTLLEVGCGTGFVISGVSLARPEMNIFGIEAYPAALKIAKNRVPNGEFAQMNAYQLPFFEEFDVIGIFDVLEHMSDDKAAIHQLYKAARPGGGIIVTVPQHPCLWSALDAMAGHKRRYTLQDISDKIQDAGFTIVYTTSFITLLFPFMLISRLFKRSKKENDTKDITCELNLSNPLNALFKYVCSWEYSMIKTGRSMPAGGSLLIVARKQDR